METLKKILKFSLVALIILTIFIGHRLFPNIFSDKASADVPGGGGGGGGDGGGGGGGAGAGGDDS